MILASGGKEVDAQAFTHPPYYPLVSA